VSYLFFLLSSGVVNKLLIISFFLSSAINTRQQDKVKQAVLTFDRASRKARDRRRNVL
jgi:hypothetical protein